MNAGMQKEFQRRPSSFAHLRARTAAQLDGERIIGGRKPRGMVLIVFLACLTVAAALAVGVVRIAVSSHKATQTAAWNTQARWLVESGIERAAAKLAADADYKGETWTIPAAQFDSQENAAEGGVVRIEVEPVAEKENRRRVKVTADFPQDAVNYARQEKQIVVDVR